MTRKLFGTDGVRGRANTYPMTAEMALRLGAAAGRYFRRDGSSAHRVVIGKDTRLSGYMLENALTAGLTSTGMNVLLLGPVPTPGVGFLTRSMRADLGVMISASHNPHQDNGIKFFGPDGFKLSDAAEAEIEAILARRYQAGAGREHRPRQADRRRARALSGIRQDQLSRRPAAGRAEGGGRLRQWRGLQGRARGAVGIGGRGDPGGRHPQRHQYQRPLRHRPIPRRRPRPWWRMARIWASRWTAMPTG